MTKSFAGSRLYMSPQVIKNQLYGTKTDVWSVGLVFLNLATLSDIDVVPATFKRLDRKLLKVPNEQFKPLIDCICKKMVVKEEDDRADIDQLIEHPIFSNYFRIVDSKAKAWLLEEAFGEIGDQYLEKKITDLSEKLKKTTEKLEQTEKNLEQATNQQKEMEKQFNQVLLNYLLHKCYTDQIIFLDFDWFKNGIG